MAIGKGVSAMGAKLRKLGRIIVDGLTLSAKAAASREGQPWGPDARRLPPPGRPDHQ
jgi:hypothetical protein